MGERSIARLVESLSPDPWRDKVAFTPEILKWNDQLLDPGKSDYEVARDLSRWLHRYQPCLFGRLAAGATDLLSYCILTERDLRMSDGRIREKIQDYRRDWKQRAYQGQRSGFVILAASSTITTAIPDKTLMELGRKLASLYLLEQVKIDTIRLDRLTLAITGDPPEYREWRVGVNYFSPQGDGRWWHDHRCPGGIILSSNSVGHMAKSGHLANNVARMDNLANLATGSRRKIDSLRAALEYAMLTIAGAQDTQSGKATWLRGVTAAEFAKLSPPCPISAGQMRNVLKGKDYCTYLGWYNTDATIPSDYFRPDVIRPANVERLSLDFTYLFDPSVENPEFQTMGIGVRVR